MIRLGKDKEAVALLVEKSPHTTPYIKALEDFMAAFAHLPAEDAYEHMVRRTTGHNTGKLELHDKIEHYEAACRAWRRAMDLNT